MYMLVFMHTYVACYTFVLSFSLPQNSELFFVANKANRVQIG